MHRILTTPAWLHRMLISCLFFGLMGCATKVQLDGPPSTGAIETNVNFVDIAKFDKDLASSLSSDLSEVNVLFYTKVSPNKLPDRIQQWISAAESAGGKVRVQHPSNEPAPRAILPLLSLLGTAYSAYKDHLAHQHEMYLNAAKGRNVVIALERAPSGDLLIEKIQFTK
jgi:hypothetical protein